MLKEKISAENHSFSEKKWLTLQNPDSIYEETKINYKTNMITKKLLMAVVAVAMPLAASAQRAKLCINSGWEFRHADTGQWQKVSLPHDYQISQPWVAPEASERPDNSDVASNVRSRLSARGFKEMGEGTYRKTLILPDSLRGRRITLDFEGMMLVGDVFLNGSRIGGTDYGYVGFEIDVTKQLKWGEANELLVKCSTMEPLNSRWYTGGGLFRDVHIVATDASNYFSRHPLKITTENNKTVSIEAEIAYQQRGRDTLSVLTRIIDAQGTEVARTVTPVAFISSQRVKEYPLNTVTLSNPRLWDCDTPYLYIAEVSLLRHDGSVADRVTQHFGVRTVEYSPEYGLKLNGRKVLLKGIANHHTLGALGAAVYPRAIEKRIQLLRQFGVNHIRTSHNPYSESFLDLCDKYGILVCDELYDKWTTQYAGGRTDWKNLWQKDVPEFVKRDRNHPSIVMWSLGNELQQIWDLPFHDWGVTIYKLQRELLRRYDATRPVTVAMHPRYRDSDNPELPAPLARVTDIAAYNYRYMYFPGDGKRYPHMKFYQSEASTAAMGQNFFEMELDKVVGLAYWGAIDYLGESQGWPEKGWAQGVFYISLDPKPKAYYMKSFFSDEPVTHIGIIEKGGSDGLWNGIKTSNALMSENWNREAGTKCSIVTYTNADEVELLLNGKSLGVKKNPKDDAKMRNQIRWNDIAYAPGKLEAVGRTGGKVVSRHAVETTGKVAKLAATPDNAAWKADGQDLQHVTINAVDGKGRRVFGADDKLTFTVEGDAQIVAVANGNITSNESFADTARQLWLGQAVVILRAGEKASDVTLRITSDKYKTVTLKLKTI